VSLPDWQYFRGVEANTKTQENQLMTCQKTLRNASSVPCFSSCDDAFTRCTGSVALGKNSSNTQAGTNDADDVKGKWHAESSKALMGIGVES
jgi:hypothetical protein